MAKVKAKDSQTSQKKMRPALTPEARENQLISLAMDLAEQRLRDGTASSQEVTHFLKLGSSKAVLERDKLFEENKLLRAKTTAIENEESSKALYEDAIKAFRNYNGQGDPDEYDDYY